MPEAPDTRPSLLLRLRDARDDRAWSEFLQIYEPLIYRLARRNGFQDADARELTQEVLLAVAKAIDQWDPDPERGSFRGWLFRIARNLMINFLARQRRHPQGSGDTDFNRLLHEHPTADSQHTADFDHEYKRQTFRWAAEQIQDEFQESTWQAFWLTCVEGQAIQKAAKDLQLSIGAVYVARSRVMARLRAKIEQLPED